MPLPTSFVVKNGFEHPGQGLGRDAAAGVGDRDFDVVTGGHALVGDGGGVEADVAAAYVDAGRAVAALHRVAGG